jgi:hypothetical protein
MKVHAFGTVLGVFAFGVNPDSPWQRSGGVCVGCAVAVADVNTANACCDVIRGRRRARMANRITTIVTHVGTTWFLAVLLASGQRCSLLVRIPNATTAITIPRPNDFPTVYNEAGESGPEPSSEGGKARAMTHYASPRERGVMSPLYLSASSTIQRLAVLSCASSSSTYYARAT